MRIPAINRFVLAVLLGGACILMPGCSIGPVASGDGSGTRTGNPAVIGSALRTDGTPAVNVTVRLRRSDYVTQPQALAKSGIYSVDALTDSNGYFEISDIDTGTYRIEVNDLAATAALLSCRLARSDITDLGVVTMHPYASMHGTVDTTGLGVGRLFAQVQGCERITQVDAAGMFSFDNLPAGALDLRIVALGSVTFPSTVFYGIPTESGDTAVVMPTLPALWQTIAIAETPQGSSASVNGQFVVTGGGPDIWDTADGFHFVYQTRTGDVSIVARVVSMQYTHDNAKASVMIRGSLAPSAHNAAMDMEPPGWPIFQWRDSLVDTTQMFMPDTMGYPLVSFPQWIRLDRKGDTLSGYYSDDGINWTWEASHVVILPTDVFVGLAVTSHRTDMLCTAVFDSVRIVP